MPSLPAQRAAVSHPARHSHPKPAWGWRDGQSSMRRAAAAAYRVDDRVLPRRRSRSALLDRDREPHRQRFEVVTSVDGLDVIDGRPAGAWQAGLPGRLRHAAHRRLSSQHDRIAAFRFGSVRDAYASQTAEFVDRHVSVIGVALFMEGRAVPLGRLHPLQLDDRRLAAGRRSLPRPLRRRRRRPTSLVRSPSNTRSLARSSAPPIDSLVSAFFGGASRLSAHIAVRPGGMPSSGRGETVPSPQEACDALSDVFPPRQQLFPAGLSLMACGLATDHGRGGLHSRFGFDEATLSDNGTPTFLGGQRTPAPPCRLAWMSKWRRAPRQERAPRRPAAAIAGTADLVFAAQQSA